MAQISKKYYSFAQNTYQKLGFGNQKLLMAFGISACILLFNFINAFLPGLGAILIWFLPLIIGTGVFLMIAGINSEELKLNTLLFGLVMGLIATALTYLLSASLISLSPVSTVILLLPNIIAGGSYCMGGMIHFFECCCSSIKNYFTSHQSHQENKITSMIHENKQHQEQIIWGDNSTINRDHFIQNGRDYNWTLLNPFHKKEYEPSAPIYEEVFHKNK